MTDNRDICERLECPSYDGAIFMRLNAAKEIRALRHYVARLEHDLAKTETDLEKAWHYSSKQAVDIVTLGQEVGRLREALEGVIRIADRDCPEFRAARAALAETGEK